MTRSTQASPATFSDELIEAMIDQRDYMLVGHTTYYIAEKTGVPEEVVEALLTTSPMMQRKQPHNCWGFTGGLDGLGTVDRTKYRKATRRAKAAPPVEPIERAEKPQTIDDLF